MTIARSGPADPVTHAETPGGSARPSPYHVPHEFLLLSRDLPGRHDVVADALRPIVVARGGGWVGCRSVTGRRRPKNHDIRRNDACLHPVALTAEEFDGHRRQCATSIAGVYLNPGSAPGFDAGWAQVYRGVNERFADTAGRVAAEGGVVLVVGHQLQLVPAMLRRRRPDLLIAFFLELPLPAAEVLRPMPIRRELVTGALGADLIGFQTPESADNFRRIALNDADVRLGSGGLDVDGRRVGIGVFPQSVDAAAIRDLAATADNRDRVRAVRAELGNPERILLAVDDLHVASGIEQRLAAYELLLDSGDVDPDGMVLVQVVRPDPTRSPASRELRTRIEHRVGLINRRHGQAGRPALDYRHRAADPAELVALYTAADVLWATPLHAGTHLVAKEYLAARADNSGSVVLSEFCGAVDELVNADLTNPHDVDHQRQVVRRAVVEVSAARRRRMATMRRHVQTHDVHRWAGDLLTTLGRSVTARPDAIDRM